MIVVFPQEKKKRGMEPFISLHEPLHAAQEDTDSDRHTDSLAPQHLGLSNSEAAQKDREDSKEITFKQKGRSRSGSEIL